MSDDKRKDIDEALSNAGGRGLSTKRNKEASKTVEHRQELDRLIQAGRKQDQAKVKAKKVVCPKCDGDDIEHRTNMHYRLGSCRGCGNLFPYAPINASVVHTSGRPLTVPTMPDPVEERLSRMPRYRDPRKNFKPGDKG